VQYLNLAGYSSAADEQPVLLHEEALDDWLSVFCELSGSPLQQHHYHRLMLSNIPDKTLFAVLTDADEIVACGLGVLETGCLGLFDLVTAEPLRNRGYGTRLVTAMLRWAQAKRAVHAYLQVVENNAAALRLYHKCGFRELYRYWYRLPAPG
jgi:GNAT superfamily N-acetyltransferase